MIILDTNVVSEALRLRPDQRVARWIDAQAADHLYLCAPVVAELRYGVACLPDGHRRDVLTDAISQIEARFETRTLPFNTAAARLYGRIVAQRQAIGRPLMTMDAQIAAIAMDQKAALATRNVGDFVHLGLTLHDPFDT
jgi:predicted nucleic acid-binding protein